MWRMTDGVPEVYPNGPPPLDKSLTVLTAVSDGSIWGATDDADLVVYDGTQWSVFDAPAKFQGDGFVGAIAVAADGTVWLGRTQSDTGGLIRYDGDWNVVGGPDGLAVPGVVDLALDHDDAVLALVGADYLTDTPGTIIRIDRSGVVARLPDVVFESPTSITVDTAGRWRVLDQAHPTDVEVFYLNGESITRRRFITDLSAGSTIGAEIATSRSDTWLLIGALLHITENPGWAEPTQPE